MNVCGFIVVRKPMDNYDPLGRGIWPKQAPHIGSVYYGGAWRMPWYDIEADRYVGKLPSELKELYIANVCDSQGSSFALCNRLDIAEQLLQYCNREIQLCELIAVCSARLCSIKGIVAVSDGYLEYGGFEPFQIGGDSLLVNGLFGVSNRFPNWQDKLNRNGLLPTRELASEYVFEYQDLVRSGLLEELFPTNEYPIDLVEILSVKVNSQP
jgi:hypothetical protein